MEEQWGRPQVLLLEHSHGVCHFPLFYPAGRQHRGLRTPSSSPPLGCMAVPRGIKSCHMGPCQAALSPPTDSSMGLGDLEARNTCSPAWTLTAHTCSNTHSRFPHTVSITFKISWCPSPPTNTYSSQAHREHSVQKSRIVSEGFMCTSLLPMGQSVLCGCGLPSLGPHSPQVHMDHPRGLMLTSRPLCPLV